MNLRTKISGFVLALLLSAPAFAQQPRIDRIAVDEGKGELVLLGNFQNSSSAIVLVDSVSLPVTSASDTIIRATIPDNGKGSAGRVEVSSNGNLSNSKILTYFHFWIFCSFYHHYSDGSGFITANADSIHSRGDLTTTPVLQQILCSKISRLHASANGWNGLRSQYTGPKYDTTTNIITNFGYDNKAFDYFFTMPQTDVGGGDQSAYIVLDNNYQIVPYSLNDCGGTTWECFNWGSLATTDFPPSISGVHDSPSNPNILQAHISSDPVAPNAEVILTLQNSMNVRMDIMDILGHIVFSNERMLSAGENKLPINSSRLPSGIYICRLQASGEAVSVRFVKESN
jgi:hypothetical protein